MFDGNTFLPVTGTPMRIIACMIRPFADADPVPFAVAILNAKLLTRSMKSPVNYDTPGRAATAVGADARCLGVSLCRGRLNTRQRRYRDRLSRMRNLNHRLPHVPRVGRASLRAQSAVHADVLVLHHHAARLLERG